MKCAVSVIGPFTVTDDGFNVSEVDPDPVPIHEANLNPGFGMAVIGTTAPEFLQLLDGVTDPCSDIGAGLDEGLVYETDANPVPRRRE